MEKQHSPTKATLMSMCLPGLGQIYNKKYWKVPIIYAGIGVLTYLIIFNTDQYLTYKCAYIESYNNDSSGNYSEIVNKYTLDNIASQREYYRRNLEVTIIFSAIWYGLNILDACVDAHLFTYNINKDLSLKVEPTLIPPYPRSSSYSTGVRFCLKF
ncbi:MAG: DUF5683 domain-containing protein [Bacteroidetes bacterium]|nr:DUF5683 domain-containing protein [Bacteroidota bacterium]